ncbi:hypothetical protein AAE478_006747 [Parahypoxylon ruwenzoriense]
MNSIEDFWVTGSEWKEELDEERNIHFSPDPTEEWGSFGGGLTGGMMNQTDLPQAL